MRRSPNLMGFAQYCTLTWPGRFTRQFSSLEVADDVPSVRDLHQATKAVMVGGQYAIVLERGKGKTTLSMALSIWMAHQGLRRFPMLLCDGDRAKALATDVELMLADANARWRTSTLVHRPLSIDHDVFAITRPRPGTRSKVDRPDCFVIDDPQKVNATAFGNFPSILFGSLAICQHLHAIGWHCQS